ncbi:DUF4350 domain-containing protein [Leucothrix arctica]|uniref:DUF4350 domain-containing protein n=1 Tax=Leucothrix arctica TaxID=1481894 RepID=A0A317CIT1_9GAMM|nr:DUF4350 domain-containing protein [Leucothrix arctica]PWQ98406.1 hypothetical protein DKT75_04595 [Leucothrix arctica]
MKINARGAVPALVIVTLISLLTFGFFHLYERVEESGWKPLTGEAKSNPLFASRLFLKRMGIPTQSLESLHSLVELPSTNSVILLTASRYSLSEQRVDELLAWVEQGGHLIIPSTEAWQESYYEFDEALVDETSNDNRDAPPTVSADPIQNAIKVHIDSDDHIEFEDGKPRKIQLPNATRPLEIAEDHFHAIILDDDNESVQIEKVQLDNKNFIIRQGVGAGLVTLVSQLHFMEYRTLYDFDHAEILWYLVHRNATELSSPDEVWLIHSDESPSLLSLIWKKFWAFILMLTALLVVWGLRTSRRFGPLIPKEDEDRRHLMEHITASGAYYWKHKQGDTLINSTRTATNQRLSRRIPGWQSLTKDQQAEAVAKRLTLDTKQVFQTLHGNISNSPYDFTETIKQLEYIRTNV